METERVEHEREDWLKPAIEGLGLAAAGAEDLLNVVSGLMAPNRSVLPALARELLAIAQTMAWFLPCVAVRSGAESLAAGLKALSSIDQTKDLPSFKFGKQAVPYLSAFAEARRANLGGLGQLLAVMSVGAIGRYVQHPSAPTVTVLEHWAGRIRAIARSPGHTDSGIALAALESADLGSLITHITANLAGEKSPIATEWRSSWVPFLSSLLAGPLRDCPTPPTPPPSAPGQEPADDDEEATSAPVHSLPFGPKTADFDDEPAEEVQAQILVSAPTVSKREPDRKTEAHWGRQNILRANHQCIGPHIEAYLPEELAQVAGKISATRSETEEDLQNARASVLAGLSLFTSSPGKRVGAVRFSPALNAPWFDLAAGHLVEPLLQPANCFRPGSEHHHLFQVPAAEIRKPLPPSFVALARKLFARFGGRQVSDWFPGVKDLDDIIRGYLRGLEDVSPITKSAARLRRTASVLFQEAAQDLAMTMTLAGDTLGCSLAPLHYYAMPEADLQDLFIRTFWPPFGATPVPSVSRRIVGSAWVVKEAVARKGIRQLCNRLNWTPRANERHSANLRAYHNALTDAVVMRVAVTTTHRPYNALFRLTRFSFDTRNHFAVLMDKRSDPEHLTRPAATTSSLSEQIELYLLHLVELGKQPGLPEQVRTRVCEILDGRAPLFAYLEDDFSLQPGDIKAWKKRWPTCWAGLASNFYRPLSAFALRQEGVEPMAMMIQLGHLEAAGHPFGPDAPVSAMQWLARVRPRLEKIEERLGFKMLTGLAERNMPWLPLPPIRSWDEALAEHKESHRSALAEYKLALRAASKEHRLAARKWASEGLRAVNQQIAAVLDHVDRPSGCPDDLKGVEIDDAAMQAVLDAIEKRFPSLPARVAVHNLLSRRLRRARAKLGLKVMDIGSFIYAAAADPSPFLPDSPLATMQIFEARSALRKEQHSVSEVTRRALALVLFDGLSSPADVFRIASADLELRTVPTIATAVFGDLGPFTFGFRGIAALSLAATKPSQCTDGFAANMARTLPPELAGTDASSALSRICSTAAVARRVEQSGLSLFCTSQDGCIDAPAGVQAAFFAGEICDLPPDEYEPTRRRHRATPEDYLDRGVPAARARYSELLRAVQRPRSLLEQDSDDVLGVTKSYAPTLTEVKQALAVVKPRDNGMASISQALWGFADDMANNGTAMLADPQPVSIYRYLTAVGPDLVENFSGFDLLALDCVDFEDAYLQILDARAGEKNIGIVAGQLLEFHDHLMRQWGVEPIDRGELRAYLRRTERPDGATLVTEGEYDAALRWLLTCTDTEDPLANASHGVWRRRCRAATVALILLWRSGGRIGEIAWLRHCDLVVINGRMALVIRPSLFRRLKTRAARRLIRLWQRLTEEEKSIVLGWINDEKERLGDHFSETSLAFCELDDPRHGIGTGELRRLIELAFQRSVGRHVWPHLLRHSWASRQMADTAIGAPVARLACGTKHRATKLVSVELGHVRVRTSFTHYVHVGWLFTGLPEEVATTWHLPAILGALTDWPTERIYKRQQRGRAESSAEGSGPLCSLFKYCRPAQPSRLAEPRVAAAGPEREEEPFPTAALDSLLQGARGPEDLRQRARAFGLSTGVADALEGACHELAELAHFRVIPLPTRRGSNARTPVPRRIGEYAFLKESLDPDLLTESSHIFLRTYRPSMAREDQLVGDEQALGRLVDLLEAWGIERQSMQIERNHAGRRALAFRNGAGITGFHYVAWQLAMAYVWSRVRAG